MQKTLAEKHENLYTVVGETKDDETDGVQILFTIDPSLYRAISDLTKADQAFYKGVTIEI